MKVQWQVTLDRIFKLLAAGADEFDAARKLGMWMGPEGAGQFWTENRSPLLGQMEGLWLEFWEGIDRCLSKNDELSSK